MAAAALPSVLERFYRLPVRRMRFDDTDVQSANTRFVLYVLVPMWILPGLFDWYWHKRTDIENTAGLKESLIHSLMMSEVGLPIVLSLLLEVNPLILTISAVALAVHTATAVWDVRLAVHHREVKTGEQHTHSFMEVLPFMGMAFAATMHSEATHRLLTGTTKPGDWQLKLKKPRLSLPYLLGVAGLIVLGGVLPYANEAYRCIRQLRAPKRNTGFYKDLPEGAPEQRNC